MGYKTHSGGNFSGDLLIADACDLAAANFASEVVLRPIQEAQVAVPYPVSFPLQDATQLQPPHEVDHWNKPVWVEAPQEWDDAPVPARSDAVPYLAPFPGPPELGCAPNPGS